MNGYQIVSEAINKKQAIQLLNKLQKLILKKQQHIKKLTPSYKPAGFIDTPEYRKIVKYRETIKHYRSIQSALRGRSKFGWNLKDQLGNGYGKAMKVIRRFS